MIILSTFGPPDSYMAYQRAIEIVDILNEEQNE